METRSNLRRKELHGANQDSNFLRHSFIYKYHVRTWIQFKRENKHLKIYFSNHIQDEIFQVCSQMGGAKRPPSINLSYISYNDGTWHSYTLPKEDPKNIWIVWHTSWVLARLHISAEVGNFWHYLPIFGLEFESNVVTYEVSPLEFLWLQPFCERVKVLKFRPKVPYLGIFGV